MSGKLIVLAHGIGDAAPDFYEAWAKIIAKNHDLTSVTIKGLCWEDSLQKVADKYGVANELLGEVVDLCGFANLKKWTSNDDFKLFKDYIMDLLVYVGLSDMWLLIQDTCALKLDELCKNAGSAEPFDEADTILVGHSLGAAMLPHLVWREYAATGTIPYGGMILLASPLGFESPNSAICGDFLGRMGQIYGGDRDHVLARFARAWNKGGDHRLKFINNENDIVCSDVKYKLPGSGELIDLIPLRQGFDPAEINILNSEHEGCVEFVSFGKREPSKIADNHEILTYLKQQPFNDALAQMLSGGGQ